MLIKIIIVAVCVITIFSVVAMIGVNISYKKVFSRADYDEFDTKYFFKYDEIDTNHYKRQVLSIPSGENKLAGYLYGQGNKQGLIVLSPGHRDASDIKLPEIMYFVDKGWTVLCYDYTGCYGSEGKDMVGYVQASKDLEAVLDYIENNSAFDGLPVMLFGHSLGAYASASVLQHKHNITAVLAASGFDDPMEQWGYSVKRFTGFMGGILSQYAKLYMKVKFGNMAHYSAIDGINSTDIPVLIMQGTTDEYYGNVSSIYKHRDRIKNPNCTIQLMDRENHHGHYDYFLSDKAIEYQRNCGKVVNNKPVDKFLFMEHDRIIMDYINDFFKKNISGRDLNEFSNCFLHN